MFRDGKGKDLLPMKPKDCKYNTTEHKYSDINQIYSPYRLTNKGIPKTRCVVGINYTTGSLYIGLRA